MGKLLKLLQILRKEDGWMEKDLRSAFNTRQYLLRSDYEIFFYSDRTISGILDHAHDFYEFYLLLSGDVSMAVDETEYRIAPGSLILIRPGQKHRLINHDLEVPYARYVFWISADCYSGLCGEYPDLGFAMSWAKTTGCCVFPLTLAQFGDVRAAVTALIRETRTEHFGKKTGEAIQMRRLLLSVSRAVYEQSVAGRDIAAEENLVDKAISYVEENLDRDLSGDEIAASLFVSKFHLAHLFRKQTGMSLHQYVIARRLETAADVLLSGSVRTAFEESGFRDYSAFYKAFTRKYGMSPRMYRQQMQNRKEAEIT